MAAPMFFLPPGGQAAFTIALPNDAIVFVEIEPGTAACRAVFWLSTDGLGERFAPLRDLVTSACRSALSPLGTAGRGVS